jgi:bifunctional non-homologous end joining protein LigD
MTHHCVIGGWTEPRGSRPFFGSLLVGVIDEQNELRYVGRVASGFTDAQLGLVWKQLHTLKAKSSSFAVTPETPGRAHWVKPALAVRVEFSGWTRDGRLRRPLFAGLETPTSAKATVGKHGKRERTHKTRPSVAADAARGD